MRNGQIDGSQVRTRLAGLLFLIAVGVGVFGEFGARGQLRLAARVVALLCYLVVTVLFYQMLKPVDRRLSLVATILALLLIVVAPFRWHPGGIDVGLVCFGSSWLVVAYLVFRSGFFPKSLSLASAIAGVAWLTFLSHSVSHALYPYNLAVGILGQIAFCLWLIVYGARPIDSGGQEAPSLRRYR